MKGINYEVPHCEAFFTPNIRLRILFSNTLSLHSSLNVREHVSQPYSTTGNIIALCILIIIIMYVCMYRISLSDPQPQTVRYNH